MLPLTSIAMAVVSASSTCQQTSLLPEQTTLPLAAFLGLKSGLIILCCQTHSCAGASAAAS